MGVNSQEPEDGRHSQPSSSWLSTMNYELSSIICHLDSRSVSIKYPCPKAPAFTKPFFLLAQPCDVLAQVQKGFVKTSQGSVKSSQGLPKPLQGFTKVLQHPGKSLQHFTKPFRGCAKVF